MTEALVIGAGPAGLAATEALAQAGHKVLLVEAKPSVGRKLLMAGKSGLNLTKDEPFDTFLQAYGAATPDLRPMLTAFDNTAVQAWAKDLGQDVFTGSSLRVFPKTMKASPLLRAWLHRLADLGAELHTSWRWTGWDGDGFAFDTPEGPQVLQPKVTVLALGGASWARLGSDGAFAPILAAKGVDLSPFKPANMGFCVDWSNHMAKHFGSPVKGATILADDTPVRGESVVSSRGIEGGGIYAAASAVRDGARLSIDLRPDWTLERVISRLARPRGKASQANHLRKTLQLDPVKLALLQEFGRPLPQGKALARLVKNLPITHTGPRPIDEAISVAGGIRFDAMDPGLMLNACPGVFAAGEMLDWEAPTGGYLINACLATGRWAGQHAAQWARDTA